MVMTQRSSAAFSNRPSKMAATSSQGMLTIGDLAKSFGVSLRTLRFYEDRGLLSPHRDGNSRFYNERDKAKLELILKGKQLGFTLGEIRDLIATKGEAELPTSLSLKPEQIVSQIDHLKRQRTEIDHAIAELNAAHARMLATKAS